MTKRILVFFAALSLGAQAVSEKTWTALTSTGVTSSFSVPAADVHTLSVVVTGSPSGCTINLDGSLDGAVWFNISRTGGSDTTCTSSAIVHVTGKAVMFVRANLTALSGGTSPRVVAHYVGHSSGGR